MALSERCLLVGVQQCVLTGCLLQVGGEDVSGPPGRVQQHGGGAARGGGRGGLPLPLQVHGEHHNAKILVFEYKDKRGSPLSCYGVTLQIAIDWALPWLVYQLPIFYL